MMGKKVLQYLDRTLRDICGNDEPFGGKVLILGGDWKQLPPVVEHGTREDQVDESIKMDPLFRNNFKTLRYFYFSHKLDSNIILSLTMLGHVVMRA